VAAASGTPDVKFWRSVCNLHGASGFWSKFVSGWVQTFFPYLNDGSQNEGISQWRENYEKGTGDETERYNRGELRPSGFRSLALFIYTIGLGSMSILTPTPSSFVFIQRTSSDLPAAGHGTKLDMLPSGLSQAPVKYVDVPSGKSYSMTFNGGLVAVVQSRTTRTLMPLSGWAVLDHGEQRQK
jgi:hypothetical protein